MKKKAIIFGATGFIGSYLLDELLNNSDYELVTVVIRKELNRSHPKLKILQGDYDRLPDMKENIIADDIFITLGTTKKNTPNQDDYPVLAAKIAKENGARSVFLVSAVGANVSSNLFYPRTKGEVERDIIALDLDHTHIFRPSMLMGTRKENRPLEKFIIKIWGIVNLLLIGKQLKHYRGIDGKDVAKAMNNAAKNQTEKVKFYYWNEMNDLI